MAIRKNPIMNTSTILHRMTTSYALAMTGKRTAAPSARSNRYRFFRPKTGSKIFDPYRRYYHVSNCESKSGITFLFMHQY
ncbi:MAG: hypothetical protein LBR60_07105 [Fibrobacter sp.]|nr:hypothetical protein [Fibrobacter sp.]